MCAIFGFIAHSPTSPTAGVRLGALSAIVAANIARGPHSFGFAWIDRAGRLHRYKQCGRLTDTMGALALMRGARVLIGHLRFATHGEPNANINNHPHACDGGWLVHNGVITNYPQLVREHRLWTVSECDSEALGLLAEASPAPTILGRCVDAVEATAGGLAMMGLWSRPATLVVARRGNPLHWSSTKEGTYFATLAAGLPGAKVHSLPDHSASIHFRRGATWVTRATQIERQEDASGWELFDRCGAYRGG
jgi:glucosamine 6-phosphate synthetase-like amidotransferase/phosphosugar isomerase protein